MTDQRGRDWRAVATARGVPAATRSQRRRGVVLERWRERGFLPTARRNTDSDSRLSL